MSVVNMKELVNNIDMLPEEMKYEIFKHVDDKSKSSLSKKFCDDRHMKNICYFCGNKCNVCHVINNKLFKFKLCNSCYERSYNLPRTLIYKLDKDIVITHINKKPFYIMKKKGTNLTYQVRREDILIFHNKKLSKTFKNTIPSKTYDNDYFRYTSYDVPKSADISAYVDDLLNGIPMKIERIEKNGTYSLKTWYKGLDIYMSKSIKGNGYFEGWYININGTFVSAKTYIREFENMFMPPSGQSVSFHHNGKRIRYNRSEYDMDMLEILLKRFITKNYNDLKTVHTRRKKPIKCMFTEDD